MSLMKYRKPLIILVISVIIGLLLRLSYLNTVPVSLSHDEIDNVIQAHAVIEIGRDIEGSWHPLSFLPNTGTMSELGPLINTPTLSFLPQSPASSRLMTVIYSSLTPLLVLIWLLLIRVKRPIAIITAILLYLSPWHVIFSRTALEQPTSLFWYLASWVCLALFSQRKLSPLSLIGFFMTFAIGFFTYHGYKFALPMLTGVYLIYLAFFAESKRRWTDYLPAISWIAFLFIRTITNYDSYGGRSSELIFTNIDRLGGGVNAERTLSLAPEFAKQIFSNKYLSLLMLIRDKYLTLISPQLLFIHGETMGVFSAGMGYFYPFTLPFMLYGIGHLLVRHSRPHLLILLLLILSPTATVIHLNDSMAFRSAIYLVILNIVLAYGIYGIYIYLKQKSKIIFKIYPYVFAVLFGVSTLNFAYHYLFTAPIENAQAHFFDERLLANYVRLSPNVKILIIDNQPRYVYSNIVLVNQDITSELITSFNNGYSPSDDDNYQYQNLTITNRCPEDLEDYDTAIIRFDSIERSLACPSVSLISSTNSPRSLVSSLDSGELRRIIGDQLCDSDELNNYVHPTTHSDFDLETMNRAEFCQKWVVVQN